MKSRKTLIRLGDAQAELNVRWAHVILLVLSCGSSNCRDFSAYISGSHKRTRSQCKKICIFPNFDEKIPNLRKKFPKLDNAS